MTVELDKIVSFKTTMGVELVAQIKDMDSDFVLVSNPLMLMQVQHQNQVGFSFAPLLLTGGNAEEMAFPMSTLMCLPVPSRDDIKQKYVEYTTGLVIPQQSILLG